MNIRRILGVLKQEYFITKRSVEIIFDILFMPLMSIIVFGFFSTFLAGTGNPQVAHMVLMGMLLWQFMYIIQYSLSVGSMWNIWSRNLSNMFVAPLQVKEYLTAHTVSGIVKSTLILTLSSILCIFVFNFNIAVLGLPVLLLLMFNFVLFACGAGLVILALIFRFGTRIQALAWGMLPILQPLTAAFYPVSVLPEPVKSIALLLPPTYLFEAARTALATQTIAWNMFLIAFGQNILFIIIAVIFFKVMFKTSKTTGQFARNEG